jgi:hypothetical protein
MPSWDAVDGSLAAGERRKTETTIGRRSLSCYCLKRCVTFSTIYIYIFFKKDDADICKYVAADRRTLDLGRIKG